MFRPYLYRDDGPELVLAKNAPFDNLYGTARATTDACGSTWCGRDAAG
jgi:hypothetical protein